MGKFKFDGKYLKEGGRTIANVSGDRIRKGTGSSTSEYHLESKNYKSKHSYSLAQYGLTKEMINEELGELMKEFSFSTALEA